MTDEPTGPLVRHLRQLLSAQSAREGSDPDLLQRFAIHHDETAFAALVQRHGALVWGVCRRLLGHDQDAEDAFQATFLVLARKAGSVRKQEALGSWLYGVARRVAQNARKMAARRQRREQLWESRPPEQPVTEAALREVQALLDEEVGRLPEKYRAPFVLCCLQGRSKAEAAAELGWREGTLSSRLAHARQRLQRRLLHRGVALPAALAALAIGHDTVSAAMPTLLLNATLRGIGGAAPERVVALAKGAMRSMIYLKLKAAAVILAVGVLGAAGATLLPRLAGPVDEPSGPAGGAGEAEATWQPRLEIRGEHGHARLDFAPDGKTLWLLLGERGELRLLDTATWKERGSVRLGRLYPAGFRVNATFSPDGGQLAVVGWQKAQDEPSVSLIDVRSLKIASTFAGQDPAFAPDGKRLATIGPKQVRLWDRATGKEQAAWPVSEERGDGKVTGRLVFSPDGRFLAWGGAEAVHLWDVPAGKERLHTKQHLAGSLPFSPDGRTFATAGPDRVIRLWDTAAGRERMALPPATLPVIRVGFLPDGKSLLTVEQYEHGGPFLPRGRKAPASSEPVRERPVGVKLWDVATGKERLALPGTIRGQNWAGPSPDGKLLAYRRGSDQEDRYRVLVWDLERSKEICSLPLVGGEFTPDGKGFWGTTRTPGPPSLWDVTTGKKQVSLTEDAGQRLAAIAFAADGNRLALATWPSTDEAPAGTAISDIPVRVTIWQRAEGHVRLERRGEAPKADHPKP